MTTRNSSSDKRGRYANSQETRLDILRAAEKLFGRRGIENTSTRTIATAAGQANVAAVQYHFGSKEGLIEAIFETRVMEMEGRRRRMIEAAGSISGASMLQLLEMVFLPSLELVDEDGAHVYVRMLLDYLTRLGRFKIPHPAYRSGRKDLIINDILDEIDRRLANVSPLWEVRYAMMVAGFYSVINEQDLLLENGLPRAPLSDQVSEMLSVMVMGLEHKNTSL